LILKLSVTLGGDKNCVDPVVQGIMQLVRQMPCAQGKEEAIQLALNEALANAVVHGAKADPSKSIECRVSCDESRGVLIVVRDPGKGFDPATVPSPVVGDNLFSEHGRGIYLINQLMDEVKFLKNGSEIHMSKR
jgi:serine/threonine-protein kinase RsbW